MNYTDQTEILIEIQSEGKGIQKYIEIYVSYLKVKN